MDTWTDVIMNGNIILQVIMLQAGAAVFVLFLLKKLMDRELFGCALEKIASFSPGAGAAVDEVVVVSARKLSGDDDFRLRTVIRDRFPQADIIIGEDRALGGGLVIRCAGEVIDLSLWTRIKQLFRGSGT